MLCYFSGFYCWLAIYGVLSRSRICWNLRFFGANFFWPKMYLCFFYYFLHLWWRPLCLWIWVRPWVIAQQVIIGPLVDARTVDMTQTLVQTHSLFARHGWTQSSVEKTSPQKRPGSGDGRWMAEWKWRCELIEKAAAGWPNLKLGSQQSAPTNLSLRQADLWGNHLEWIHTFRQTKIFWALFASHVIIFLGTLVIQLQDDPALPFHKLHFASEGSFLPSKVNIYLKQLFLSFWWFIEFNMLEKLQKTQSALINLIATNIFYKQAETSLVWSIHVSPMTRWLPAVWPLSPTKSQSIKNVWAVTWETVFRQIIAGSPKSGPTPVR